MQQQLSKEGEAPTESGVGIQNTQMNSNDTRLHGLQFLQGEDLFLKMTQLLFVRSAYFWEAPRSAATSHMPGTAVCGRAAFGQRWMPHGRPGNADFNGLV